MMWQGGVVGGENIRPYLQGRVSLSICHGLV